MSGLLSKICGGGGDFTGGITEALYQLNINNCVFSFCLVAVAKRVLRGSVNVQKLEL